MATAGGEWIHWLTLIGIIAIGAALIYGAWWGLFSDRARGRRRCPKCWYDLAYSPGMMCAECGFVGTHESQFRRTRRRYGVATASILACVVLAAVVNDRVGQQGFTSMLPTRMLLWLLPFSGTSASSPYGELMSRQLTAEQKAALIQRCAAGDWRCRPVSDGWIRKYGDLIASQRRGFLGDGALESPLWRVPPRLDVTTRDTWPLDTPIAVSVQLRDWWPWGMECRIRATPKVAGQAEETLTFYRTGDDRYQRPPYALYLPPLQPGVEQVTIDFEIDRRRMANARRSGRSSQAADAEWEPVAKQSITLATRAQGTLQQMAQPVNDPALLPIMTQVFQNGAVRWSTGASPVRFYINVPATHGDIFNDTAIGVKAELMCDGQVARRLHLWWLAGSDPSGKLERHYGFEVDYEDVALLKTLNADDGRWNMRVRGDAGLALRAGTAKRYWAGELVLPLRLQTTQGQPPPRGWWTGQTTDDGASAADE